MSGLHSSGGGGGSGGKSLPTPDGVLTVTPDVGDSPEFRSRRSPMDIPSVGNILREEEDGKNWGQGRSGTNNYIVTPNETCNTGRDK